MKNMQEELFMLKNLKKLSLLFAALVVFTTAACNFGTPTSEAQSASDTPTIDSPTSETPAVDYTKLPYYIDPETAEYGDFSGEKLYTPFWQGNVIYNETVMLVEDGETLEGKLQFEPVKILSVRDHTWKTEYAEGKDYVVNGNVLTLGTESSLPYLMSANLNGEDLPEPYRLVGSIANIETDVVRMGATIYTEGSLIYGHQISVSYVYDPADIGYEIPTFSAPKTLAKLKAGEPVTIAATGDSVMQGCSSSGFYNRDPYMKTFIEQVKEGLENEYDSEITLSNQALGGMTSTWGAADAQLDKLIAAKPDILFVHFGINDAGGNTSKNMYGDNLECIVVKIHDELPDCEIVLMKAFTPHPMVYDEELFGKYWDKIDEICAENENTTSLDLFTPSKEMLKVKKYMDVTGNGINHLNDFSVRLYAMYILNSLIEY